MRKINLSQKASNRVYNVLFALSFITFMCVIMLFSSCEGSESGKRVHGIVTYQYFSIKEVVFGTNDSVVSVKYVFARDKYDADRIYNEQYYGAQGTGTAYQIEQITIMRAKLPL